MFRSVARRIDREQFDAFQDQGEGCGWCRHPIRIRGTVIVDDGVARRLTFSTATLPDGVTLKACGSRRETRCPACAASTGVTLAISCERVSWEARASRFVAQHLAVFVTLTAPSFGAVHAVK